MASVPLRKRAKSLKQIAKAPTLTSRHGCLIAQCSLFSVIPIIPLVSLVLAGFSVVFSIYTAMFILDAISHFLSMC